MAPFPLEMDGTATSGKGSSRKTGGLSLVCYHGMPDLDLLWPREGLNTGLSRHLSQLLPQHRRFFSPGGKTSWGARVRPGMRGAGTPWWWDHWP